MLTILVTFEVLWDILIYFEVLLGPLRCLIYFEVLLGTFRYFYLPAVLMAKFSTNSDILHFKFHIALLTVLAILVLPLFSNS